jgi:hypothetical protein
MVVSARVVTARITRRESDSRVTDFRFAAQEYDPAIALDEICEHPENYNEGADGVVSASLDAHGFYGAVLVQKSTGYIIAGNTRYRSSQRKGAATLPGFWLDVSDDEAREILLVDNGTARLSVFDEDKLIALLQPMDPARRAGATSWSDDSLAALLRHQASISAPGDDGWDDMPDFEQGDKTGAYACHVHFATDDDADAFFALLARPRARVLWWPQDDGHKGDPLNQRLMTGEDR